MRQNTEKLEFLSQKMELGSKMEGAEKSGAMQAKEMMLKDMESRLKFEKQEIEAERKRLANRLKEFGEKESR